MPTSGSSSSRGSTTSTTSVSWAAARRRSARSQAKGRCDAAVGLDEVGDHDAQARAGAPGREVAQRGGQSARLATSAGVPGAVAEARSARCAAARLGSGADQCSRSRSCGRAEPVAGPWVSSATAATTPAATWRFSRRTVPKCMLAESSTSTQVSSSCSASGRHTWGSPAARAVTFQSMRRTSSSPGR